MINSLETLIAQILKTPPRFMNSYLIAIDGPAGAGKSTLARRIAANWPIGNSSIVGMDDLYDGWDNALTEQLTRTLEIQILKPLTIGKPASFRSYDWLSSQFGEFKELPKASIYILEGVGSGQRISRKYLDQLIWIDIDQEVGLQRVLQRDGDYLEAEMRIWQMREQSHFAVENTRDCATFRFDGSLFI